VTPDLDQIVIAYTYEPLGRLTGASYSDGTYFNYTYDAVGNRLTEQTSTGTTTYIYDNANRLTSVGGVTYSWDNNGNLTNDGTSTYTYDHANRLKSVTQGSNTYTYAYRCNGKSSGENAFGCESDRVSQTVNGVTTHYVVDSASPLSYVLSDGTDTYLYGNELIAQYSGAGQEYFLTDSLGSIRQLIDESGSIIFTKSYQPYGLGLSSSGYGSTSFDFSGETLDQSGLIYLRSRMYSPQIGRFLIEDTWPGDSTKPSTYNRWNYVDSNPITRTDPSGHSWLGPTAFAMCFSIVAVPPSGRWLNVSANEAVATCRMAYNKDAWGITPGKNLPTNVYELWAWYLNEYGDQHLYFNGESPLTRELAVSLSINGIRQQFYNSGDIDKTLYKFNLPNVLGTLFDPTMSMPLSNFLGSYWYQVKSLPGCRVGFRIDNDTTLESGSHIGGRYVDDNYRGSVEDLIYSDPSIGEQPIEKVINENRVISILRPLTRSQTSGSNGGGTMYQTFTWTEKYDNSLPIQILRNLNINFLDIQNWDNYQNYTDPIF
jgi:RHS repeat-associated protein